MIIAAQIRRGSSEARTTVNSRICVQYPPFMELPRLIITGASGFIGRHLLDYFKEDFRIVGLARRSQLHCGAPVHNNITWYQVDIGDRSARNGLQVYPGIGRRRLRHPPCGPLRFHRRERPRVLADQRRGHAQRARGVPYARSRTLHFHLFCRCLQFPETRRGSHRRKPRRRRPRLCGHQTHRRGHAGGIR